MPELLNLRLNDFESISLNQMKGIRLMKRVDSKFVIPFATLPGILEELKYDYYAQETNGKRIAEYATLYYDTPDYEMYIAHQKGEQKRLKIRARSYIDSDISFLEVKTKSDEGITKKIRIEKDKTDVMKDSFNFITINSPYTPEVLESKLWSIFRRITLVNKAKTERLTIDIGLNYQNLCTNRKVSLPDMVIIEIKRNQFAYSPAIDKLNQLDVIQKGLSKYCLGIALTEEDIFRSESLKLKISDISKITSFLYD